MGRGVLAMAAVLAAKVRRVLKGVYPWGTLGSTMPGMAWEAKGQLVLCQ